MREDKLECGINEEGRVQCSYSDDNPKVGENVPKGKAVEVEREFQKRQRKKREDRGSIRNWLDEASLDDCFSKYKRSDGEIEREFVCIERHRDERIKRGIKETGKTIAPSI